MATAPREVDTVAQQVDVKTVFCMEGEQGETSYMNNSQVQSSSLQPVSYSKLYAEAQSRSLQAMFHALEETLDKVHLPRRPERLLTAADLGCSCGQNTLVVADVIVQHMTDSYGARGHAAPEFCFYFSDLPSNDFNTLFHLLLPKFTAAGDGGSGRRYFGAGVPGSFHDRLFPERFINVFISTFSLHWLSQVPRHVTSTRCSKFHVPEAVADKRSAAYSKGKVFVHGGSEATGLAYKRQFQSDLARFLRCRAAELKRGGAMFLVCLGRPSSADPTDQGRVKILFGTLFQDSWGDLVREGLIDREEMDSFNVPLYATTLEEFREVVDADGSFEINRLELVMGSPLVVDHPDDPRAVGRTVANNVRSFLGALVDAHVGKALADELFARLQRRAEARGQGLAEEMRFPHVVCSLSLSCQRD